MNSHEVVEYIFWYSTTSWLFCYGI